MLPKEVTDILEDVFGHFSNEDRERAKKEPESCLISLLAQLRKDLPDVSSMVKYTVMHATFESEIKKSKLLLLKNSNKKKFRKTFAGSRK